MEAGSVFLIYVVILKLASCQVQGTKSVSSLDLTPMWRPAMALSPALMTMASLTGG
jgi:hypothetical protein